jgi:hypothetical protein
MALGTPTNLTKYDNTNSLGAAGTPYVTSATITPTANACVLLSVVSGTNLAITGVSGCNLTWTVVPSPQSFNSTNHRLSVWRGFGASPTTEAVTITFTNNVSGISLIIDQITGAATGGTNGSDAVVQSVPAEFTAASSGAVTLATFADATNNIAYVAFAIDNDADIVPEAASYTQIEEQQGLAPDRTVMTAYRVGGGDLTAGASWAGTLDGAAIAMEITAGAAASGSGSLLARNRNRLVVTA